MKLGFLIFTLITELSLAAGSLPKKDEFTIFKRDEGRFFLIKKKEKKSAHLKRKYESNPEILKINVAGRDPKVLEVKRVDVAPSFYCVVYKAGESGTSTIISEHRCALYNEKKLRFEGDVPFKYVPKGKAKNNYPQPLFKNKDGVLKIYDNGLLVKTISIP
jgi:hypothetical protein